MNISIIATIGSLCGIVTGIVAAIYALRKGKSESVHLLIDSAGDIVIMQRETIKEQDAKITERDDKIEKQAAEIEELKSEVSTLRKDLGALKKSHDKLKAELATEVSKNQKLEARVNKKLEDLPPKGDVTGGIRKYFR